MKKTVLLAFFLISLVCQAQGKFQFYGKENHKVNIKFKLINNLIVFPLEINGKKLSFILDTGVNKTVLFNLKQNDSLNLNNVKKIFIHGLGDGEPVAALHSKNNVFKIKNIVNPNESLYVILKDAFNISARMGTTIHGIIGFDVLKDVIVMIDYSNQRLTFYNPKTFKQPKTCRKCEVLPLTFYKNKPYIDVSTQLNDSLPNIPVKLLVDSGGSDAMWLFEDSKKEIQTPKKFFKDILGEGFSGTIYGNRSRVAKLSIGKFDIIQPTVSFLDTTSTLNARKFRKRNGSLGGNILRRFRVWIDYPNKKMILRKKASLKKGFYYNMSGLHVVYNGQELIREEAVTRFTDSYGNDADKNNSISLVTTFFYRFKSSYKIDKVVPDSPAEKAGLLAGDIIKSINGKPAHDYTLSSILALFHSKPNKKIRLKILRGITELKYEFTLKKRI